MTVPFQAKPVSAAAVLLFGAQGSGASPITVRNLDSTNRVWVGNVSNITTDGSNSIPLDANDSISFDGSTSIYARTEGAFTVLVSITPGGVSFAPGTVDITGPVTAVISGPVTITGPVTMIPQTGANGVNAQVVSVPANGTAQSAFFTFAQPSYELIMDVYQNGGGVAAGPLLMEIDWFQNGNADLMERERWYFWPGSSNALLQEHIISGHGPAKGASMQLAFTNFSAAAGANYDVKYWLYQTSHTYTRNDLRTVSQGVSLSGITVPVSDPTADAFAFRNVAALAAGAGDTTILPLFNGLVQINANTGSGLSDMQVIVQDAANPNAEGLGGAFFVGKSDANGNFSAQIALPRYQCQVRLVNNNAAAKTVNYWAKPVEVAG